MARFLAYTTPARGHLYPIVPTLLELRRRGHEVAVRTLAGQVAMLRGLGLEASPLAPEIEAREIDDWRARTPLGAQKRTFAGFMDRAAFELADLADALAAHAPDALLVDSNAWGASAAAERWEGPAAAFHAFPLPMRARGVPPFGPGLAPARGPLGHARDRALAPLLLRPLDRFAVPRLNAVRERAGVPPVRSLLDTYPGPLPLLHLSAEPFEYPRAWPENVHLVGPGVWDPPAPSGDDDGLLAWLDALARPLVLVSTSSEFQDDGRLVDCALAALASEDVAVVATVPAASPPAGATPANARVLGFVAHGPLLERAAAVVCHAGMGVTQKALAHAVPVCAVPFGRDQLEVARRVEVAGAGVRLPARRLSPERLRHAVRETLRRREGARRVAAGYARAGGPARAAELLEALLPQRAGVPAGAARAGA